jgi:hypothetical protein
VDKECKGVDCRLHTYMNTISVDTFALPSHSLVKPLQSESSLQEVLPMLCLLSITVTVRTDVDNAITSAKNLLCSFGHDNLLLRIQPCIEVVH